MRKELRRGAVRAIVCVLMWYWPEGGGVKIRSWSAMPVRECGIDVVVLESLSRRRTDVLVPDEGRVLEQPGAKKIAHLTDVERPHVRRFVVKVVPLRLFRCERRHDQAGACAVRGELRYTTVFWRGRDDAEYQYLNVSGTVRVLLSAVTKRHTTLSLDFLVLGVGQGTPKEACCVEAWRRGGGAQHVGSI